MRTPARHFAEARIGGIVRRAPGPPGAEHLPPQALARRKAQAHIARPWGADLIAADQGVGAWVAEGQKHPFTPTEDLRPRDHALEHGIEVQGRTQALGDLRQQRRFLAAALQLGLGLLPRRDIPRDRGRADELARAIPDRRDGERDVIAGCRPWPALRLIMLDAFPPPQPRQDLGEFIASARRGDQARSGSAPGLGRRVAVEALRSPIPARDAAVQGLTDDRVLGGLDNGRQGLGPPNPPLPSLGDLALERLMGLHHRGGAGGDPLLQLRVGVAHLLERA